jgi:leader peptidase (prepilin peptidase) / N-methyltransferase
LRLILVRVFRDLSSLPLLLFLVGGTLGIVAGWFYGGGAWLGLLSALIGLVVSGGIVWIIRIVGTLAMRREAMGFGDVTLMMMIGTFLGWQASLITFFLAPFAAIILGIIQLLLRRGDVLPYGPFLCLAAASTVLAWATIWDSTFYAFEMPLLLAAVLFVCFLLLGCMLFVWRKIKESIFGIRYE